MDKITFEDLPSENSPINAENLNQLQDNAETAINTKLDKMVVSKSLNTAGWYRVAKYNSNGGSATSFLLNINTTYRENNNLSATFEINIAYHKAKITQISSVINEAVINKIRVVEENNEVYVEIYYNPSRENNVFIDILNQKELALLYSYEVSILNFEAPTDTATVLDECPIGEMIITNNNTTAIKLPDGTLIQKGEANCTANGSASIRLPVDFIDTGVIHIVATQRYVSSVGLGIIITAQCFQTAAELYFRKYVNGTLTTVTDTNVRAQWVAIGRWK